MMKPADDGDLQASSLADSADDPEWHDFDSSDETFVSSSDDSGTGGQSGRGKEGAFRSAELALPVVCSSKSHVHKAEGGGVKKQAAQFVAASRQNSDETTRTDKEEAKGNTCTPCKCLENRCSFAILVAFGCAVVLGGVIYVGYVFLGPQKESDLIGTADFIESPSLTPTATPTATPIAFPSAILSATPMAKPTETPTLAPTHFPTAAPTGAPTNEPTMIPTTQPSTAPPTLTITAPTPLTPPASTVSTEPTNFAGHGTFSFFALGDGPYEVEEEDILRTQLRQLSADPNPTDDDDGAVFMVFVGDIMKGGREATCERWRYTWMKDMIVTQSSLPALMLPGDNDWLDCPLPDVAWEQWEETFAYLEQNWSGSAAFPAMIERDDVRIENFAFAYGGVLFIGVNVIRLSDNLSNRQEREIEQLLEDNALWLEAQVGKYGFDTGRGNAAEGDIRAIIMFGHAFSKAFFKTVDNVLEKTKVPVLYIHGNGHTFKVTNDVDDLNGLSWSVQVDQLGIAPPIKVTVQGTKERAAKIPLRVESSNQYIFGDFIRLDRRGGTERGPLG